jgi:hypothetical protein
MKTLTLIAAFGALLMTESAVAASVIATACAGDAKQFCSDVKPGGGALKDCVTAHFNALSADCRTAIESAAAAIRDARANNLTLMSSVVFSPKGILSIAPVFVSLHGGKRSVKGETRKEELVNTSSLGRCLFVFCRKDGLATSVRITSNPDHRFCS